MKKRFPSIAFCGFTGIVGNVKEEADLPPWVVRLEHLITQEEDGVDNE